MNILERRIPVNLETNVSDYLIGQLSTSIEIDGLYSDGLILESATLEDIDLAFFGNELLAKSEGPMLEAITTQRIKLAQTMRAFIRVLNRGLNGTGIRAGADEAGSNADNELIVGGAIIGKVRRVTNIPVMTAQIPLTDGQSTSIIFHSPTAEGIRVKNNDTLVAFQFLLNKRDVTHVVAPIGGRDVTLNQVCQALANLIERNSAKFNKGKERQERLKSDTERYQQEGDALSSELSALMEQIDNLQKQQNQKRELLRRVQDALSTQKKENDSLESRLSTLRKRRDIPENVRPFTNTLREIKNRLSIDGVAKLSNGAKVAYSPFGNDSYITIDAPEGQFRIQSEDMQGVSMAKATTTLLKAYREGKADKYRQSAAQPQSDSSNPKDELTSLLDGSVSQEEMSSWYQRESANDEIIAWLVSHYKSANDDQLAKLADCVKNNWIPRLLNTDKDEIHVAELARQYVKGKGRKSAKEFLRTYFTGDAPKKAENPIYVPNDDKGITGLGDRLASKRYRSALPYAGGNSTMIEQARILLASVRLEDDPAAVAEELEQKGYVKLPDSDQIIYESDSNTLKTYGKDTGYTALIPPITVAITDDIESAVSELLHQRELLTKAAIKDDPQPSTNSQPEQLKSGSYRYALTVRPASPGSVPDGSSAIDPSPDAAGEYSSYARHGVITYADKLTDAQANQFDLLYLPTNDELGSLAATLVADHMDDYANQYAELAKDDRVTFKKQVRILYKKSFPTIAWPLNALENDFVMSVIAALPEPEPVPEKNDTMTEIDENANDALAFIRSIPTVYAVLNFASVKEGLNKLQNACNTLVEAGRFEENEALVDEMSTHLINMLGEIQRNGGY